MDMTLNKIKKTKHLSQYDLKDIIEELPLYQPVLVDTYDVVNNSFFGTKAGTVRIYPGKDVLLLEALKNAEEAVMLPCVKCGHKQAFRNISGNRTEMNETSLTQRVNNLTCVVECLESYSTVKRPPEIGLKINSIDIPINEEQHLKIAKQKNKSNVLKQFSNFSVVYECPLDPRHHIYVNYILEEIKLKDPHNESIDKYEGMLALVKVGQYPSMADMNLLDSMKYKKFLKDELKDYTMALRLFASGIGCGSFLYLRRVLEAIVSNYHSECINSDDWDEDIYTKADFNEKIKLIESKGYVILPDQIQPVRNKLYGVLSKGIHKSTEDECKDLFPYVQFAIELIIEKELQEKERQKKIANMQKIIQKQSSD